ncbi:Uncharacterised protein [Legionella quateirensis]|uniref:Uncharacterized protein n=1 Tax=Legionella quateirensis TaxID=45072 RepID=A0A378KUA8_9GAMM|nr:hypothetical protein Lqua_3187 [Legionella quateirensis]STY18165.1 Uncharacterised protein [Legionella quateirensis]
MRKRVRLQGKGCIDRCSFEVQLVFFLVPSFEHSTTNYPKYHSKRVAVLTYTQADKPEAS